MEDFGLDLKHEEILDDMVSPFSHSVAVSTFPLSVGSYEKLEKYINSTFLIMIHIFIFLMVLQ